MRMASKLIATGADVVVLFVGIFEGADVGDKVVVFGADVGPELLALGADVGIDVTVAIVGADVIGAAVPTASTLTESR